MDNVNNFPLAEVITPEHKTIQKLFIEKVASLLQVDGAELNDYGIRTTAYSTYEAITLQLPDGQELSVNLRSHK